MKKLKQKITQTFRNNKDNDAGKNSYCNYNINGDLKNGDVVEYRRQLSQSSNTANKSYADQIKYDPDQYDSAGKYNHFPERHAKSNRLNNDGFLTLSSDHHLFQPYQQQQYFATECGSSKQNACGLPDSINHLAGKLAADGVIVEENHDCYSTCCVNFSAVQSKTKKRPISIACAGFSGAFNTFFRSTSSSNTGCNTKSNMFDESFVILRPNSWKKFKRKGKSRVKSWHISQFPFAAPAVVHEAKTLGSDGESVEVSPCTSDQISALCYQNSYSTGTGGESQRCYVPNVKMRQKPPNRRWSEQDIQKRLSLPADIKLPQTVVEKLNRTPTLDNPLTRKSRRASLSEIGFGKLETYKKLLDLGEGTYATVYLGKSLLTGKSVALKEIRLNHEEGAPCTAIREVSLLRNLRHVNVVTLHDVIYTDRILTLVFEFVEHDLREYMEEVDGFVCMNNVKLFMIQLLRGLAYCHKRRILHRDLKPQNLLINRIGELKLADFGLARAQSVPTKTYSNEVVTLWYRPPDVLLGSTDYSTHIDMWGIGCIFYELLANRPLFSGSTTDEQLNLIFQRFGTPAIETDPMLCRLPLFKLFNFRKYPYPLNFHLSMYNPPRIGSDCTELLQKFLKYDGRLRVSALEAMSAGFFADFPRADILRLPDTESVLSLPSISYVPELNHRRSVEPTS